jgi:hypothetical protein
LRVQSTQNSEKVQDDCPKKKSTQLPKLRSLADGNSQISKMGDNHIVSVVFFILPVQILRATEISK